MATYGNIDITKLNHLFDNTVAAYKYLWFLSLLDIIDSADWRRDITFNEMVARMLGKAWTLYTKHQLSFGRFDLAVKKIIFLMTHSPLKMQDIGERIKFWIMENPNDVYAKEVVKALTQQVPYRFLYPWLGRLSNGKTAELSRDFEKYGCLYSITKDRLRINEEWGLALQDISFMVNKATWMQFNEFLSKRNHNIYLATDLEEKSIACASYYIPNIQQIISSGLVAEPIQQNFLFGNKTYINYNAPVYNQGGTMNGNVKNNHPKQ